MTEAPCIFLLELGRGISDSRELPRVIGAAVWTLLADEMVLCLTRLVAILTIYIAQSA